MRTRGIRALYILANWWKGTGVHAPARIINPNRITEARRCIFDCEWQLRRRLQLQLTPPLSPRIIHEIDNRS